MFNPVKSAPDGRQAEAVVWTTELIRTASEAVGRGKPLVANPFFMGQLDLLRENLVYSKTPEEDADFLHCMNDIIYFASYCKLKTPEGYKNIVLRDYQKEYLRHLVKNRMSIFLACRQAGKTTTTAIFALWFALTNCDKNIMITGNKLSTAHEILDKAKNIFLALPMHLKPGTVTWNVGSVSFDNGCRILTSATTKNSGISYTLDLVIADEFAHVQNNIARSFYENIFPTITAGKYRFAIMSTQNGLNLFHDLWVGAVTGKNEYAPFKVTWDMVPNWDADAHCWRQRDEKWKETEMANLGSEEAFYKQYGTSFDVSSTTLLNPKWLKEKQEEAYMFTTKRGDTFDGFAGSDCWRFANDFDQTAPMLFTIDLAEGIAGDSTVINCWRVSRHTKLKDQPLLEQQAIYEADRKDVPACMADLLQFIKFFRLRQDRIKVSIEMNLLGDLAVDKLINARADALDDSSLLRYMVRSETASGHKKFRIGVKMSAVSKKRGCQLFKSWAENGFMVMKDEKTIQQLVQFADTKNNGTYQAQSGHDDIAMTCVQAAMAVEETGFRYMFDDIGSEADGSDSTADAYSIFERRNIFDRQTIQTVFDTGMKQIM